MIFALDSVENKYDIQKKQIYNCIRDSSKCSSDDFTERSFFYLYPNLHSGLQQDWSGSLDAWP